MKTPSTEKRLDGLNVRMTEGFNRLDDDIREVRGEIGDLRREMNQRFAGADARFESVEARFDAMHRTMMRGFSPSAGSW